MAGRPKGSTNHDSKIIKEMVISALTEVGGKDYLIRQAEENPSAFIGLIGKAMPKDVAMEIRRSIFEEDLIEASANESIEHYQEV